MSSRYSRQEFYDADILPSEKCDRQISEEKGDATMYMACDYHEGFNGRLHTRLRGH